MNEARIYTKAVRFEYTDVVVKDHAWIKASFWFYHTGDNFKEPLAIVMTFENRKKAYYYHDFKTTKLKDVSPNKWVYFETYMVTPEPRIESDDFVTYFWYTGKNPVFIDDLKIECFDPWL